MHPMQWTQCEHGQLDAYRSRTVHVSGKIGSVNTALVKLLWSRIATCINIVLLLIKKAKHLPYLKLIFSYFSG